jgi:hypothetical protein
VWRVILGLGPIWTACLWDDGKGRAEIDPLGCEDGPAVTGCTDTEGGIPIGQNLARHATQIIQAGEHEPEGGWTGAIEREADGGCSAAAEHRDQTKELGHPGSYGEGAEVCPVDLDLKTRIGLEAHFGFMPCGGAKSVEMTQQGLVASRVAVLGAKICPEIRPADHRTDSESAFEVRVLRLRQRSWFGSLGIVA